MGKVRRYKKKLAKAAAENNDGEKQEQSQQTDILELAEELLNLKKDDDKMSVTSVMKSVKSMKGDDSLRLKKDAKRYLKHAFLLKRLEKTQKSLKKKKSKTKSDSDDDNLDDNNIHANNQKVLNWSSGNTNNSNIHCGPTKKYKKGFQKKQNALLAKDLVLFSKKIKKISKHPVQKSNEI